MRPGPPRTGRKPSERPHLGRIAAAGECNHSASWPGDRSNLEVQSLHSELIDVRQTVLRFSVLYWPTEAPKKVRCSTKAHIVLPPQGTRKGAVKLYRRHWG